MRGHSGEKSAINEAIRECIDRGILAEYLKRKGSEVENMLIAEYSYEEPKQEGLILSGRIFQTVKSNPNLTNEQIAAEVSCEPEEVEITRNMFGI